MSAWEGVEWVDAAVLDSEDEEVAWTWSDGRVDLLPSITAYAEALPGAEVGTIGTYSDGGMPVGGQASRLCRGRDDLWYIASGAFEEQGDLDICRSRDASAVLQLWLPAAAEQLGHFADLTAFAAARLSGLLPDEVDAAVMADLEQAVMVVAAGDEDEVSWSGVVMFCDIASELGPQRELARRLLEQAPVVKRAVEGDSDVLRVLNARRAAWLDVYE